MWLRVEHSFPRHPKLAQYPPQKRKKLIGCWVMLACHCVEFTTDGVCSESVLRSFCTQNEIETLLQSGLLREQNGSILLHDFLEYNMSREEHRRRSEAAKKGARARWDGANGNANRMRTASERVCESHARYDTNRYESTENALVRGVIEAMQRYPKMHLTDSTPDTLSAIVADFPRLDVVEEAKAWATWASEAKRQPKNCASSLRNWCKRSNGRLPPTEPDKPVSGVY